MLTLEMWIGGAMLVALILYALSGGADFGGGVWELFAFGPQAKAQRNLISHTIAPIWEANHVWLIVVIVLLFTGFPQAFAAIMTALHIPLTLMLIGIVLRGSAFAFRAYGIQSEQASVQWGRLFAITSLFTPITLGIVLGGVISEQIRVDSETGVVLTDFFSAWLAPFPILLGLLVLALFAYLAAVYLTNETADAALQDDFRLRALISALVVGVLAFATLIVARNGAPRLFVGLSQYWWAWLGQLATGLAAIIAILALWQRRYPLARTAAIVQVTLMIVGWGVAQYPFIVPPDLTFSGTAAPDSVLRPLLITLIIGGLLILPAFLYLYRTFTGHR
jgi:cytochrome d ubiquinol oxidase subunit II